MVLEYIERKGKYRSSLYKDKKDYYSISNSKNGQGKIYKKYLKGVNTKKYNKILIGKKHLTKRKNLRKIKRNITSITRNINKRKNSKHKSSHKLKGGNIFADPVPDRMGISPEEMRKKEEARKKAAAQKIAAIKAAVLKSTQPTLPTTPNKMNATHLVSQVLHHTSGLGSPIQHIQQIQSILPTQSSPITTPVPVRTPIRTFKPGKV